MMPSILLLSTDRALDKSISAALPGWVSFDVENLTPPAELLQKLDTIRERILILIDMTTRPDVSSWLPALVQAGLSIVAIISTPDERNAIFRLGIRDYLLLPLIPEEIKARISQYLPESQDGDDGGSQNEQVFESGSQRSLARQIIQNERLITIGRLFIGICHDLTNRMQATQGALSLALEEPAISEDMHSFLSICQQETRRACAQVERLRYIYHPEIDQLTSVDIVRLLNEVIDLATEQLTTRGVTVNKKLPTNLPIIRARIGQLQFALLGLLLNLIDLINPESGGCIQVEAVIIGPTIQIGYSTDALSPSFFNQNKDENSNEPEFLIEYALGLPTLKHVIRSQNGEMGLLVNEPDVSVWLGLPIM